MNQILTHPRIELLKEFYNSRDKVCPFMNTDITKFVLVENNYSILDVGSHILRYAKTKNPMVLTYVWEKDPDNIELEKNESIMLFGKLLKTLREDETHQHIDERDLEKTLREAFSSKSKTHPHLSYSSEVFYSITMGPRETSRYAPCFSMVITRMSDVKGVQEEVARKIREESSRRFGREYDANALFLKQK